MEEYGKVLGNKIKALRVVCGLTQAELAEYVNRTKNHISKIELGTANPPLSLLIEIAKVLQVTPSELLGKNSVVCIKSAGIDFNKEFLKIKDDTARKILIDTLKYFIENYS